MADEITLVLKVDNRDLITTQKEQRKFQRNLVNMEKALRSGQITAFKYNTELQKQKGALAKLGGGYTLASKQLDAYSARLRAASSAQLAYASSAAIGGKSTNRMGMQLQQVGYQVGDFAVQMQGGTNAAVALGQQGSQLLGIFGPVGALAGAGLAIGTAFIAPMLKAKKATEEFGKELEEVIDKIGSNAESIKELMETALSGPLEKTRRELISVKGLFQDINDTELKSKVAEGITPLLEQLDEVSEALINAAKGPQGMRLKGESPTSQGEKDFLAKENILVIKAMEKIKNAMSGPASQLGKELVNVLDTLEKSDHVTESTLKSFKSLLETSGLLSQATKQVSDEQERVTKSKDRASKLEAKALKKQAKLEIDIFNTNAAYEIKVAKANRIEKDKLDKAGDNAILKRQAKLEKKLFADNQAYEKSQKALDAAGDLAILENNARIAKELFDKNSSYENKQASIRASAAAKLREEMLEMADRLAIPFEKVIELIAQAKKEAQFDIDTFGGAGDFKYGGIQKFTPEDDKSEGSKTTIEDTIKSLQRQIDKETVLSGVTGIRKVELEIFTDLMYANEDADIKTTDTRLRNISKTIAAERDRIAVAEEAARKQKALGDSIAQSAENGLMAMVDGTLTVKEAFKSMASEIIKELYRVLVVQKIVSAARVALSLADGGVISNGSQVTAYANGGIVGSPTTFAMSGGRTGLMGEAGPEAIMPLKRGSNGKLGVQMEGGSKGGDNVVIHQNFNFQANGDDTVKKLIAQAAPKIMSMTKTSLIEDRRRGGSTKAAFG